MLKITTNHIERMWVELRRDLRGVVRSELAERVDEVPYRLYRLSTGSVEEDFKNAVADIVVYADKRRRELDEERRRAVQRRVLERRGPLCAFRRSSDGTTTN